MIIKFVPRLDVLSLVLLSKNKNPLVIPKTNPNPDRNFTTQKNIRNVRYKLVTPVKIMISIIAAVIAKPTR